MFHEVHLIFSLVEDTIIKCFCKNITNSSFRLHRFNFSSLSNPMQPLVFEILMYFTTRGTINSHHPTMLDNIPVFIRLILFSTRVPNISPFSSTIRYTTLDIGIYASLYTLLKGIRVLFWEYKHHAKHHLATSIIGELVLTEFKVNNIPVIQHIDYLASFKHITTEPIRVPSEYPIILARLNVV